MTTVGAGKYTYRLIQDWAKLPPGESFGTVSAIATDSQDRVYAFQRKEPPVVIFDREGNYLGSWGNGSFVSPHGLYISDDIVYVTDREGSVAMKYTLDGKPLQILGVHGVYSDTGTQATGEVVPRSAGPFNYLTELVPGPSGDLYVSDGYRNARVHRFGSDGHLISSWGEPGKGGPNQFHLPHSLSVGTGRPDLPLRPGEQPDPNIHRRRTVRHHVDRHEPPSGHLPGQRGHLLHQREGRKRHATPSQRA